tara:strand:+ start:29141 stop:33958 length:4818 start_codon:yes stop_codon:yes gene_type:complete
MIKVEGRRDDLVPEVGGIIKITPSNMDNSRDELFSEDPGWTELSSGSVSVAYPYTISFTGPGSYYLESPWSFVPTSGYCFSIRFKSSGEYGGLLNASKVASIQVYAGAADYADLYITLDDSGNARMKLDVIDAVENLSLNSQSTTVALSGGYLLLSARDGVLVGQYVSGNGTVYTLTADHTIPASANVRVGSSENSAVTRQVRLFSLQWFPLLTGFESVEWWNLFLPRRKSGQDAFFSVNPEILAEYDLSTIGSGVDANTTELLGSLEIGEEDDESQRPFFVLSQIERFYNDGGGKFICPLFGDPQDNRGDMVISNRCFDDGSLLNNDELLIRAESGGQHRQQYSLLDYPQFSLEDPSGDVYGHNYDWFRIQHLDDFDGDGGIDTAKRMLVSRNLPLDNGLRLLTYGIQADEFVGTQDVFVEVSVTWSDAQDLFPESVIDELRYILKTEEGNVVYDSGTITRPAVDADPTVLEYSDSLDKDRYVLEIYAFGAFSVYPDTGYTPSTQGLSIEAYVYEGTTNADPELAKAVAEAVQVSSSPVVNIQGISRGHFTIGPRSGSLIFFRWDPSTNEISKVVHPTVSLSLRSDSVSAFQHGSKIVFMFEESVSGNYYDDRSRKISYVSYDEDTSSFGALGFFGLQSPNTLGENEDFWTHAFDVVYRDGTLDLFLSYAINPDELFIPVFGSDGSIIARNHKGPFYPIGPDEIYVHNVDVSGLSFDGEDYFISPAVDRRSSLKADHFRKLFHISPNMFLRSFGGVRTVTKYAFFDSIRASYDENTGITLVSAIDVDSRAGLVWAGSELVYKEVAIPFHFNYYHTVRETGYRDRMSMHLDSFDSVLSPDGAIVSVASRGEVSELGFSDFSIFFENNDYIVDYYLPNVDDFFLLGGGNGAPSEGVPPALREIRFYPGRYRFKAVTFQGTGIEYESNQDTRVSICSFFQHLIVDVQSGDHNYKPCHWVNGFHDKIPFEVPDEMTWTPELGGDHDSYSLVGDLDEHRLRINPQIILENLTLTLDTNTAYRFKYSRLDLGYRFHARLRVLEETFTFPLEFYAQPYFTDNVEPTPTKVAAEVRWNILGDTAQAQAYDYNLDDWVTLGEVDNFQDDIWDLYIFVRRHDNSFSRYQCAFVAKRSSENQLETSENLFDWSNEDFFFFERSFIVADTSFVDDETVAQIAYRSKDTSTYNEFSDIYVMGYCTIKGDEGIYVEEDDIKGGNPEITYIDIALPGEDYRVFDDTRIFESRENEPQYLHRMFKLDEDYKTGEIHWYNGFAFSFAGESSIAGDSWSLTRSLVNDLQSLKSKSLHGLWASSGEDEDVYIWADAFDSLRDKFVADTFFVKGVNVTEIDVVAKDNLIDPWTTIGSIDLERGKFTVTDYEERDQLRLRRDDLRLYRGKFLEHEFNLNSDAMNSPTLRIDDSDNTDLFLDFKQRDAGFDWSTDTLRIFSSRGYLKLDDTVSYRFLGFKIPAQRTYEGWFQIHTLDFGHARELPVKEFASTGSGESYTTQSSVYYVVDNQPVSVSRNRLIPTFLYEFSLASAELYLEMLSMVDNASVNSDPIWVVKDGFRSRDSFELTLIDSDVGHSLIADRSFEEYGDSEAVYRVSISFRSVGE